jgi:formylglycine-generating enzyme required for sulfatase activity
MKLKKNSVFRVRRGGGYYGNTWGLRVPFRSGYLPEGRSRYVGFRFVVRGQK